MGVVANRWIIEVSGCLQQKEHWLPQKHGGWSCLSLCISYWNRHCGVHDLLQWDSPTGQASPYQLCCKIWWTINWSELLCVYLSQIWKLISFCRHLQVPQSQNLCAWRTWSLGHRLWALLHYLSPFDGLRGFCFLIIPLGKLSYMKNSQSQNDKKGSRMEETSRGHLVQPFVESRL